MRSLWTGFLGFGLVSIPVCSGWVSVTPKVMTGDERAYLQ